MRDKPLISVLTPVHDPPLHMLEEAIASVRSQTFSDWELCLVDDGSTNPEVIAALERHAASDPRIHLERRETAGGISAATNAALELATGEYIALLDHDDTLAPDALQRVADQIAAQPDLDMIYSDEDIVMDGQQIWLHLKPAWSPDTLRTNGYTCHLGVYRRALVTEIGGFRSEFDGSQDVDMILRLVERTDRIAHIPQDPLPLADPRRLYGRRRRQAVRVRGGAQRDRRAPGALRNRSRRGIRAARALPSGASGRSAAEHRARAGRGPTTAGSTRPLDPGSPSRIPTWNVVLAAPARALAACADALRGAGIADSRLTTIATEADWDSATALAAAAGAADAEHLLIMQTPAIGLTHDWLTRLLGYSNQPHIAAAGPVVLAGDGRIQHAGIAIPEGIPLHLLHGTRSSMDHFFGYGTSVYNVSAVSGVLATRRETLPAARRPEPAIPRVRADRLLPARDRYRRARRHRPRRPPAHHRARHHHQRPPGDLGAAPELDRKPTPTTPTTTPTTEPTAATSNPSGTETDDPLDAPGGPRRAFGSQPTKALPAAGRLPLAALRATLDEASAGSSWLLHPDGVLGRALLLPAGATFTVPLKLSGEAFFSGAGDAAAA